MNNIFVLLSNLIAIQLWILEDFREYRWLDVSELWSGVFVTEELTNSSERPTNGGIKMIFDGVVSSEDYLKFIPAFEEFRNINPSVFIGFMSLKEEFFFLLSPRLFVDFRVQLVMPSWIVKKVPLSALFSWSASYIVSLTHNGTDKRPVLQTNFFDDSDYGIVLLKYRRKYLKCPGSTGLLHKL